MLARYADKVHFLEIPESIKSKKQNADDEEIPKYMKKMQKTMSGRDLLLPSEQGNQILRNQLQKKEQILGEKSRFFGFLESSNVVFVYIVIYCLNLFIFVFHCLIFMLVKFYYLILGVTAGMNPIFFYFFQKEFCSKNSIYSKVSTWRCVWLLWDTYTDIIFPEYYRLLFFFFNFFLKFSKLFEIFIKKKKLIL